ERDAPRGKVESLTRLACALCTKIICEVWTAARRRAVAADRTQPTIRLLQERARRHQYAWHARPDRVHHAREPHVMKHRQPRRDDGVRPGAERRFQLAMIVDEVGVR